MTKYQFTDDELNQHHRETGHSGATRMCFLKDSLWTCKQCAKQVIEEEGICGLCHQLGWDVAVSGPWFRGVAHSNCWDKFLAEADAYLHSSSVKTKKPTD